MRRAPAILVLVALAACKSTDRPAERMQALKEPMVAPPPGKVLVVVHRDKIYSGAEQTYVRIWDGDVVAGDLGSGQALHHVCEPGKHMIVSVHGSGVSVVEATFFPDQVYDFCIKMQRGWSDPLFLVAPVYPGSVESFQVLHWLDELQPVAAAPDAPPENPEHVRKIIEDFTTGLRRGRLLRMAATDNRRPTGR
jgi:hypothetical protein